MFNNKRFSTNLIGLIFFGMIILDSISDWKYFYWKLLLTSGHSLLNNLYFAGINEDLAGINDVYAR